LKNTSLLQFLFHQSQSVLQIWGDAAEERSSVQESKGTAQITPCKAGDNAESPASWAGAVPTGQGCPMCCFALALCGNWSLIAPECQPLWKEKAALSTAHSPTACERRWAA